MKLDPDEVSLESVNKLFEYEKVSREIDNIDDIELLRTVAKCYVKLYYKQAEVVAKL